MSSNINMQGPFKLWLNSRYPDSKVIASKICGAGEVYLFHCANGNLKGAFIQGEATEVELDRAMQELTTQYGSITILNSEKHPLLAHKYLPQAPSGTKTLVGKTIRVEQVQTSQSDTQPVPPPYHQRHVDFACSTYAYSAVRTLLADAQANQAAAKVDQTGSALNQSPEQGSDKLTKAQHNKIRCIERFQESQKDKEACVSRYESRLKSNNDSITGDVSSLQCKEVVNVHWENGFNYTGLKRPVAQACDSFISSGGSLKEFDALFPGFRKGKREYNWDVFEKGTQKDAKGDTHHYLIHKETGVVLYDGLEFKNYSTYRRDENCDIKSLEYIASNLEYKSRLEEDLQGAQKALEDLIKKHEKDLTKADAEIAKAQQNIDAIKKKLAQAHDDAQKALEKAEKKYAYAVRIMEVQYDHMSVSDTIRHLENLAINTGSSKTFKTLAFTGLFNELIMNFRLLEVHYSNWQGFRTLAASGVGATLTVVNTPLAILSVCSSIYALARSADRKFSPALTQEDFFKVINDSLFPILKDIHDSLASDQKALSGQTDEQTQILLKHYKHYQDKAARLIEKQGAEIIERLNEQVFTTFVTDAQKRCKEIREGLRPAAFYIQNRLPKKKIPKFLNDTQTALGEARSPESNGFAFEKPKSSYTIESVAENPIYSSGLIYHTVTGAVQGFPPELSILYSTSHTFIHFVKDWLSKECVSNPENLDTIRHLHSLAGEMNKGIQHQLTLFGKLETQFNELVDSHKEVVKWMMKNKAIVDKAGTDKFEKACKWSNHAKWMQLLDSLVRRKMFGWNEFVHKPMNLISLEDRINSITSRRLNFQITLLPFLWLPRLMTNDFNGKESGEVDSFIAKNAKSANGLLRLDMDKRYASDVCLTRRIWWSGEGFDSSVTVNACSTVPFSIFFGSKDDVNVISNPPSPPKNSLLNCTVTYSGSDGFQTEFTQDSRLQSKDVANIQPVERLSACGRGSLVQEVLKLMKENSSGRLSKDRYEICWPLNEDDSMPPLPLPRTLMELMRNFLGPDIKEMSLAGAVVDVRYEFDKSKNELKLHAIYGTAKRPFISCTICKFDEATVKAYKNQTEEHAPINYAELLYTTFFTDFDDFDGIPGKKTYFNAERDITAPVLERFPGLFRILEKAPHLCFNFDHTKYDEGANLSLQKFIDSGEMDKYLLNHFFKNGEIQVNPRNFPEVQDAIENVRKSIKDSQEYQKLKENTYKFLALSNLVCGLKNRQVRSLLNEVNLALPGEDFWLEQMYAYTSSRGTEIPQEEKEGLDKIKAVLRDTRSTARIALESHARQLPELIDYLGRYTDQASVPAASEQLLKAQREFAASLGFDGMPTSIIADLETSSNQKPKPKASSGSTSGVPEIQIPCRTRKLGNGFELKIYNTHFGDGFWDIHALLGEPDEENKEFKSDASAELKKFRNWVEELHANNKLPKRIQQAFEDWGKLNDIASLMNPFATYLTFLEHPYLPLDKNELATAAFFFKKRIILIQPGNENDMSKSTYTELAEDEDVEIKDLDPEKYPDNTVWVYYKSENHIKRAEVVASANQKPKTKASSGSTSGVPENESDKRLFINFKGQQLRIHVVPSDGDCLLSTIIAGITGKHPHTPESLRVLASQRLLEAINKPNPDDTLIEQLALGMRMHEEARSEASTEEDKRSVKELATTYCNELVKPRHVYPGEETIMVLAQELNQQIVLVNGNSLRSFGPKVENALPIMVYKMPESAHFNRLEVTAEQWAAIK